MNCKKIQIHTPFIKLDNLLKFTGTAESGGHAKSLIAEGEVLLDGEVCTQRGRKIVPGMKVECMSECFEVEILEGD